MKKYSYIVCLLLFIFTNSVSGQKLRIENLPYYDVKPYHFGFTLGFNNMDFSIKHVDDSDLFDSLCVIESKSQSGFQIGIVSSKRINDYLDVRFVPTISFGDRILKYQIIEFDTVINDYEKKIESTYIDFPILLKYKSKRLTNTRAFILAGFQYSLDLASQKNQREKNDDDIVVKLNKHDISGILGFGFDFYLEYFKFGAEIKMSYGLMNLMKSENNVYTDSVEKLSSKIFWISITFE